MVVTATDTKATEVLLKEKAKLELKLLYEPSLSM